MHDGLIWVVPPPGSTLDLDAHLGSINAAFADFSFATHRVYKRTVTKRQTNWKLIIEAFSESYHVARLQRNSIGTSGSWLVRSATTTFWTGPSGGISSKPLVRPCHDQSESPLPVATRRRSFSSASSSCPVPNRDGENTPLL
jgi:hypothetical protein